jgi:hypothetical protein
MIAIFLKVINERVYLYICFLFLSSEKKGYHEFIFHAQREGDCCLVSNSLRTLINLIDDDVFFCSDIVYEGENKLN